ncbi:MAG: low temperature requirement protein A [Oscillospiraceae bacterium]
MSEILEKTEKKVEYLELIYDLIFVYIIGRNNSLLHHLDDGFISGGMFIAYVVCSLAVIQIWNFSAYYINIFGKNGLREHIFLFLNMFLLYFIAEGTGENWENHYTQYHVAWALILLNTAVQYLIEYHNQKGNQKLAHQIQKSSAVLITEALLILLAVPAYHLFGVECFWIAIVFGMMGATFTGKRSEAYQVDFMHLTERAMLYVVFTFGEMIIGIAGYFEETFSLNNLYFSLMVFLIAVALFLSYETLYDHIVNRELSDNGLNYLLIHVFLIFSLNNITASLEFMHDSEVNLMQKMLFLVFSFLLYYCCLFLLGRYAKKQCGFNRKFYLTMAGMALSFSILMVLFRNMMQINILITVVYSFAIFLILYQFGKHQKNTDL